MQHAELRQRVSSDEDAEEVLCVLSFKQCYAYKNVSISSTARVLFHFCLNTSVGSGSSFPSCRRIAKSNITDRVVCGNDVVYGQRVSLNSLACGSGVASSAKKKKKKTNNKMKRKGKKTKNNKKCKESCHDFCSNGNRTHTTHSSNKDYYKTILQGPKNTH
eukprot:5033798-Amphidinium_carterae.1